MQSKKTIDNALTLSDDYQVLCYQQSDNQDNSGQFEIIIDGQQHQQSKLQQKVAHQAPHNYNKAEHESSDGIQFIQNVQLDRCSGHFYIVKMPCPTDLTPLENYTDKQWSDIFQQITKISKSVLNAGVTVATKNTQKFDKQLIRKKLKTLNSCLSLSTNQTLLEPFQRLVKEYSPEWNPKGVNNKEKKKIYKYMNSIEARIKDPQLSVQEEKQKLFITWISQVLLEYTEIDIQVSYDKGMQFLVMGIVLALANPTIQTVKNYFSFMMLGRHAFRRMYLPGSPQFFIQLKFLENNLKMQLPELYHKMIDKANTEKLFISYYKTMLFYKITDRKVFQIIINLLLIYGVRIVTMIIFCSLRSNEERLLKMVQQNMQEAWQYVAKKLIKDYLQKKNIEECLLKQLGKTIMQDETNWPF